MLIRSASLCRFELALALRCQVCWYLGGHPEGGSYGGVPPQAGVGQLGGDSCGWGGGGEKLQVSLRLQEAFLMSVTMAKVTMCENGNWSHKDF